MANQTDKKFTWVIKNFSSLNSESVYSDTFVAGRSKWRLLAKKFNNETQCWFDQQSPTSGFESMLCLSKILSIGKGFLFNGEVKIVAEVDVLEVIGKLDVPEETSETSGSIDFIEFQALASLVESVNSLFEKYPGFALKILSKNPQLRKTCLNVVRLSEILYRSPEELSNGDLVDAYSTLRCVTKAGFKLDWLEKKLKETGVTRLQEIEEELKHLKLKCTDMDALLEFLR